MTVKRFALVLAGLLAASQAQALKCREPDVLTSFRAAMTASESYVILRGSFAFDEALLPGDVTTRGGRDVPPPAPIAADFTGQSLEPDGFTRDIAIPVTVQPICFGPWCGRIAAGVDVLAFAQTSASGAVMVEANPCGLWVFPDPTDAMLEQARACTADPASCAAP